MQSGHTTTPQPQFRPPKKLAFWYVEGAIFKTLRGEVVRSSEEVLVPLDVPVALEVPTPFPRLLTNRQADEAFSVSAVFYGLGLNQAAVAGLKTTERSEIDGLHS
ncbi:hypothetical protein B7463_g1650, partial [Scytalidium lignicola]